MISVLRKIVFQSSHLTPYVPLLTETKIQKITRILNDKSNPKIYWHNIDLSKQIQKSSVVTKFLFNRFKIIYPINTMILYWYVLVIIALLYYYVEFSLVLFYEGAWTGQLQTPVALFFSIFFILIFIIDVFVQLNTGYLNRGIIVLNRKRIIIHYLRRRFIIDFSYILILILCLATQNIQINWGKFIWFLKIYRLLQIDTFFLRKFNVDKISKTVYVILKQVITILIIAHAVGVIFYIIDNYFLVSGYYQSNFCWLISSTAYSPINTLPWAWQYFYSLYWGINTITTISYGDIAPLNPYQIIYATAMFCFGFIVYGYVVNQIIKIVMWARGHKDKLREDMVVMDYYMQNLEITPDIKDQVRSHLQFLHNQEKNRDLDLQRKMINKLPEQLRYQLVSNAYVYMNEKIINIFQSSISTKFLFFLNEKKFTNNQIISYQGERTKYLNYLHKGLTHFVVSYRNNEHKIYQSQTQNQFLGHYELFSRKRAPFSIISKAGSILYSIDRQNIFKLVNTSDELKQKFKQVQYEVVFKNNLSRILYNCYLCSQNHDWSCCPKNFVQRRMNIILQESEINKKDQIRLIRRKYHTLNDRKQLKIFQSFRNMNNKRLLNSIQKRITKIKEKINERIQQMDIDIVFDWKYFQIQENLSRKKQIWNRKVYQKQQQKNFLMK